MSAEGRNCRRAAILPHPLSFLFGDGGYRFIDQSFIDLSFIDKSSFEMRQLIRV